MTTGPRPLVAGNWKMNGTGADLDVVRTVNSGSAEYSHVCDLALCVPATLISRAASVAEQGTLSVGGQDCHEKEAGAHTGDISVAMLADAGASMVIVGHSERRTDHGETDGMVRRKAAASLAGGLRTVICVGESESERRAGMTVSRVTTQIDGSVPDGADPAKLVLAYEPIWAIGTGMTPTADDIAEVHLAIRDWLQERFKGEGAGIPILYGGSVKPDNAATLLSVDNVNGALVGGASLKAEDFLGIASAYLARS